MAVPNTQGGAVINTRNPRERIRFNQYIRVPRVRVISADGEQLGVMETRAALQLAIEQSHDLIEIAPNAAPPVCKIMDFGKYKYQLSKKAKEAKKKQHTVKLKEIKLRPQTDTHDYQYKLNHAKEFLEKGDRVKFTVVFRGREMAHLDLGREFMGRIKLDLENVATPESDSRMEGKRMSICFIPVPAKSRVHKPKQTQSDTGPVTKAIGADTAPAPEPNGEPQTSPE